MFRGLITSQALPAFGEQLFTTPGTHQFTVPAGVREISCVLVGAGAGAEEGSSGGGGTLVYATIPVTPGEVFYVVVPDGDQEFTHGRPAVIRTQASDRDNSSAVLLAPGGEQPDSFYDYESNDTFGGGILKITSTAIVSGSFAGGAPVENAGGGGGGAGGYSGAGGQGGYTSNSSAGSAGTGGAGGGGGGSSNTNGSVGGQGGGVGLYGEGSSGAGGTFPGGAGGDGSGGSYGGGNGAAYLNSPPGYDANGSQGAVRIVWPGQMRRFPSTNVS